MATLTKKLRWGKGYSGKLGNKAWIARITGVEVDVLSTGKVMPLTREFVDATRVEREHFNRARTVIEFTYDLEPGLYEQSAEGERSLFIVFANAEGAIKWSTVSAARARAIAERLDEGESFEAAIIATKEVA